MRDYASSFGFRSAAVLLPVIAVFCPPPSWAQQDESRTPASLALATMFSPLEVPKRKTMGLLQRNFLEMASDAESELELALVIDGTDSMSSELNGVRRSVNRMLSDLRRFRSEEIRAAVVVYRDHGASSGEFTLVLEEFTADEGVIAEAVGGLRPESGAPFFHELPDVGLHAAITKLAWSDDPLVTKWILLFGDAPPYDVALKHPDHPTARRRYSDELLVSLAQKRGIRINSVLCTSGDENRESYQGVIAQTRDFMSRLSTDTDGVMLDLSYPSIQKALVDAGKRPEIEYKAIAPITAADLALARRTETAEARPKRSRSRWSHMNRWVRSVSIRVASRSACRRPSGIVSLSCRACERSVRSMCRDSFDASMPKAWPTAKRFEVWRVG